jgi:hypothetical protein
MHKALRCAMLFVLLEVLQAVGVDLLATSSYNRRRFKLRDSTFSSRGTADDPSPSLYTSLRAL